VAQYSTVAFTAALLGKEVHSYLEAGFLREALPIQNGGASAANIASVCRACFDSNPLDIERARARVEAGVVQPVPRADLHVLPQAGESSFVYPVVKGIRQAMRRRPFVEASDFRRPPGVDPLPPLQSEKRVE